MKVVFCHVGADKVCVPNVMVKSVRQQNPDAHIVQCTDLNTAPIDGVDEVIRIDVDPNLIALFRTECFARYPVTETTMFIDTDICFNKPVNADALLSDGDVAIVYRHYNVDGPVKSLWTLLDLTEYDGKTWGEVYPVIPCVTIVRDGRFWNDCLDRVKKMDPKYWKWIGEQEAARDALGSYKITRLPENVYACLMNKDPDADPVFWHFKGKPRKYLMMDWAARRGLVSKIWGTAAKEELKKTRVVGFMPPDNVKRTGIRGNKKRRQLSKRDLEKFEAFFDQLKEGAKRYSDPMCAISSYSFWEGIDDKEADCQFVIDILEHQWDLDAALADIKRLAKRAALICVRTDFRGKDFWVQTVNKYFHVSEVVEGDGMISLVANARTVIVPGHKIIPAGTHEGRWNNIVAAVNRYKEIVVEAPAHNRRAIIACYGPSLKETWADLAGRAMKDPEADIVSVSGSHDFLLERGITPRFHVECDPRPHKAANIVKANPETEYLLASTCSPVLFEKLGDANIRLWHTVDGEVARRVVDELGSKAPLVFGGGSVGLRSIPLMYRMGYRKFDIYGMDCSFSDDGSEKWAGAHAQKENQKEFPLVVAEYAGRKFTTTGILLTYGADFFDMMNRMLERDPSIQLKVYGDGLLQARVKGPRTPINLLLDEAA